MSENPELSVVIPVYNEESNLQSLFERLLQVITVNQINSEIVFVDDGSIDNTAEIIMKLTEEYKGFVRGVFLDKNWGQHRAVAAGMHYSNGQYIITLDADLQNPPEEILRLLELLRNGYDCVGTIRTCRQDSLLRTLPSKLVNIAARVMCPEIRVSDYGCMLRGYSKTVACQVANYSERIRFVPVLAMKYAANYTEISVSHSQRLSGDSKYSTYKLFILLWNLILSFYQLRKKENNMKSNVVNYKVKKVSD